MSDNLRARLQALEKSIQNSASSMLRVTFADGSTRLMRFYELYLYAVNRSLYNDGYRNQGGLFDGEPLPEVPYVDYSMVNTAAALISPFIEAEIEYMKGR